ncbi:MAG: response regulator [Candidatus Zixiibacteriota bacterium]|nr:MAG: response regulator [candidate division Zixibacteria bacterium]
MKILIAEDEKISRKVLSAHLSKWGHELLVTVDGTEALETFNSNPDIQIAVLDWMMPGMEGLDVCRAIKANDDRAFTYVIMLTAMTNSGNIVEALEAGADDYVTKPFNADELRARIRAGERIVNLETTLKKKIVDLEESLAHIKQLQGCLPICAWCKKIRDGEDYWNNVEDYLLAHSEVDFSHGICPDCLEKHFGKLENTP